MAIKLAVGDESFDEIRKTGLYYVDKTELLYDLAGQTINKVTLFTRPRRFGKTLNMSMMESFFDINRDSRAVFAAYSQLRVVSHDTSMGSKMSMAHIAACRRNSPRSFLVGLSISVGQVSGALYHLAL